MRFQFVAAVILGLTLIPVRVFGCTCAAPTAQVKTTSELAARNRSDAIFEGKVERVELGWKLKEAQIVVRPISYSTFRLKQHFQSAQRCPTLTTPVAGCVQGDIVEREPTVARVHSRRWDEWLFFV
jgi:hypothetical protein